MPAGSVKQYNDTPSLSRCHILVHRDLCWCHPPPPAPPHFCFAPAPVRLPLREGVAVPGKLRQFDKGGMPNDQTCLADELGAGRRDKKQKKNWYHFARVLLALHHPVQEKNWLIFR